MPFAHRVGGVARRAQDLASGSRSRAVAFPSSRGSRLPDRRPGPCRCGDGCARSAGRRGSASTARWCGSSPAGRRPRPARRAPASRCRSRSSPAGRSRRRRGRRAGCSASRPGAPARAATRAPSPARWCRSGRRVRRPSFRLSALAAAVLPVHAGRRAANAVGRPSGVLLAQTAAAGIGSVEPWRTRARRRTGASAVPAPPVADAPVIGAPRLVPLAGSRGWRRRVLAGVLLRSRRCVGR